MEPPGERESAEIIQFTFRLDPELRAQLHRAAARQDLNAGQLLRHLIREHVAALEAQAA